MLGLRTHSRIVWSLAASLSLGGVLLACDTKQEDSNPNDSSSESDAEGEGSSKEDQDPGDSQDEDASPSADDGDNQNDNDESEGAGTTGDSSEDEAESKDPEQDEDDEEKTDPRPWFKFFTTSQEGLVELAADKTNGFGGDLGGLAGADEICAKLAQKSNPGDTKTWRAFLSATAGEDGKPVHAIERVGQGPWHDYNNRLFAENVEGLLPGSDRRPAGADPQLAEMFTDEFGRPISPDTNVVDNHDMLTGSDKNGRLPEGATKAETCNDWTSKDTSLGKPRIGHAWPRSSRSGREWIYDHRAGGCGAGIDTEKKKNNGTPTVGAGGGYGGFYCFAL